MEHFNDDIEPHLERKKHKKKRKSHESLLQDPQKTLTSLCESTLENPKEKKHKKRDRSENKVDNDVDRNEQISENLQLENDDTLHVKKKKKRKKKSHGESVLEETGSPSRPEEGFLRNDEFLSAVLNELDENDINWGQAKEVNTPKKKKKKSEVHEDVGCLTKEFGTSADCQDGAEELSNESVYKKKKKKYKKTGKADDHSGFKTPCENHVDVNIGACDLLQSDHSDSIDRTSFTKEHAYEEQNESLLGSTDNRAKHKKKKKHKHEKTINSAGTDPGYSVSRGGNLMSRDSGCTQGILDILNDGAGSSTKPAKSKKRKSKNIVDEVDIDAHQSKSFRFEDHVPSMTSEEVRKEKPNKKKNKKEKNGKNHAISSEMDTVAKNTMAYMEDQSNISNLENEMSYYFADSTNKKLSEGHKHKKKKKHKEKYDNDKSNNCKKKKHKNKHSKSVESSSTGETSHLKKKKKKEKKDGASKHDMHMEEDNLNVTEPLELESDLLTGVNEPDYDRLNRQDELFGMRDKMKLFTNELFDNLDMTEDLVDFEIPPLHASESVKQLSKEQKEKLQEEGVTFQQGSWTKKEESQLVENWLSFSKRFEVSDPCLLLGVNIGGKNLQKIKEFNRLKHFYVRLGKGLNRPLFCIYKKARVLLDPRKSKGKLSSNHVIELKRLRSLYGNKWTKISDHMDRTAEQCNSSFRNHKDGRKVGKWTKEEEKLLKETVEKFVKDSSVLNSPMSCDKIPWGKVSKIIGSRNEFQCREHWFNSKKLRKGERKYAKFGSVDNACLIYLLHSNMVSDEALIDWKSLYPAFRNCLPSYKPLAKKWWCLKAKVQSHKSKSHEQIVSWLYEHYLPNILGRKGESLETIKMRLKSAGFNIGNQ